MVKANNKKSKNSLVFGIIGIILSFIPFLCIAGVVFDIIAIVAGVKGIKSKCGVGKAITGTSLGGTGIFVSVIMFMVTITAILLPAMKSSIKSSVYCNSAAYCENTCINGKHTCYYYGDNIYDGLQATECSCNN